MPLRISKFAFGQMSVSPDYFRPNCSNDASCHLKYAIGGFAGYFVPYHCYLSNFTYSVAVVPYAPSVYYSVFTPWIAIAITTAVSGATVADHVDFSISADPRTAAASDKFAIVVIAIVSAIVAGRCYFTFGYCQLSFPSQCFCLGGASALQAFLGRRMAGFFGCLEATLRQALISV